MDDNTLAVDIMLDKRDIEICRNENIKVMNILGNELSSYYDGMLGETSGMRYFFHKVPKQYKN